jgi:hypothetical protein
MRRITRLGLVSWIIVVAHSRGASLTAASDESASVADRRASEANLGRHHYQITTSSREAQRAFDRGLTLAYGFSHEAAAQESRRAIQADPDCAMAWWGLAVVQGPHLNFPMMTPDHTAAAWEALSRARALAPRSREVERSLIATLGKRYANPQPDDRAPLDQAYADALRDVWRNHPRDADVGTLYVEALMDLHPWDLWTLDGKPQPWTGEIVATLEQVLKLDPRHPGANHLYIHALEASPNPGRALPSADRLRTLVPGSSHLVHMPSHIYARVSRWDDAARANLQAMQADVAYRATHPNPGFYAMYMAHNEHFYAFTAFMQGRSAEAVLHARRMVAGVPEAFLKDYGPVADGYMIFVSEALMRFGRWEDLLEEPAPRPDLPLSGALWHYTRAVALNALDRSEDARREQTAFEQAAAKVPAGYTFGNNAASNLLAIATRQLAGEIAARAGRSDEAIATLCEAAAIEDTLRYDEPPDWLQPARHTLGAVLLRFDRAAEAETVYREDLMRYPENGWSLYGLGRALRKQGKDAEAKTVERRFARAWAKADVQLRATCLCLGGD